MSIQDITEGKKPWRAHMARVKALLPDYQIVYKEMQKDLFKVGPIDLPDGPLLPGSVDFFEEGAATGKGVLELKGLSHLCGRLPGVSQQGTRYG